MSVLKTIESRNPTYPIKWDVKAASSITSREPVSQRAIIDLIKNAKNKLLNYGSCSGLLGVAITCETPTDLPGFRTPILVEVDDRLISVSDMRGITAIDVESRKLTITNERSFKYETFRLATQAMYMFEPDVLEAVSPLYGKVLIRLVTQTLGRSFKLDPEEQNKVRYLVANYWLTSFEHHGDLNVIDHEKIEEDTRVLDGRINRISRLANTTPELYRLVHDGSPITSSKMLVDTIVRSIDSPKISHLDLQVFINIISRLNNISPEAGYNMVVGIDHPPTFYANVLSSHISGLKTALLEITKDTIVSSRDTRAGIIELIRLIENRLHLTD